MFSSASKRAGTYCTRPLSVKHPQSLNPSLYNPNRCSTVRRHSSIDVVNCGWYILRVGPSGLAGPKGRPVAEMTPRANHTGENRDQKRFISTSHADYTQFRLTLAVQLLDRNLMGNYVIC